MGGLLYHAVLGSDHLFHQKSSNFPLHGRSWACSIDFFFFFFGKNHRIASRVYGICVEFHLSPPAGKKEVDVCLDSTPFSGHIIIPCGSFQGATNGRQAYEPRFHQAMGIVISHGGHSLS